MAAGFVEDDSSESVADDDRHLSGRAFPGVKLFQRNFGRFSSKLVQIDFLKEELHSLLGTRPVAECLDRAFLGGIGDQESSSAAVHIIELIAV